MRVKVIKLDERNVAKSEEENKYIGQTFEALVFYNRYEENEDYKTMYALGLENDIYYIPACCCEVIDADVITTADNKVIKKENILLVEDGSVDIDQLEEDGFYVIVYRQSATPPMWLK